MSFRARQTTLVIQIKEYFFERLIELIRRYFYLSIQVSVTNILKQCCQISTYKIFDIHKLKFQFEKIFFQVSYRILHDRYVGVSDPEWTEFLL